jgi:hypothetical protein
VSGEQLVVSHCATGERITGVTSAERIGNDLKWVLVNCAMTPRDQTRPEL